MANALEYKETVKTLKGQNLLSGWIPPADLNSQLDKLLVSFNPRFAVAGTEVASSKRKMLVLLQVIKSGPVKGIQDLRNKVLDLLMKIHAGAWKGKFSDLIQVNYQKIPYETIMNIAGFLSSGISVSAAAVAAAPPTSAEPHEGKSEEGPR